jgi:hypothetical protein
LHLISVGRRNDNNFAAECCYAAFRFSAVEKNQQRVRLVVVESYRSFHLNLKVHSLILKEKESFGDLTQCTAAIGYWNSEPRSKRLEA